jgi:hypothetical protein
MRVLVDDKPVDALTPKQERTFFLSKVQEEVKGRILTPIEATEVFIAQTRQWYMIFGSIGLVLMVGVVIAGVIGEPNSALIFILFAALLFGALVLLLVLMLRHRVRVFSGRLAHRSEGLMPVGTVLAIDGKGLSIGPEMFAWPMLVIDTVELSSGSLPSGDTTTPIMIVERLAVSAGGKVFMLDRAMTQNGMLLVDNVWRRLRAAATG